MLTQETLNLILSHIAHCGTTVADIVIMAMCPSDTTDGRGTVHDVSFQVEDLLNKLHGHQLLHRRVSAWVHATMKKVYTMEILSLSRPDAGLHYIAKGLTENKLREFNINDIIKQMSAKSPLVWELLDDLLSADSHLQSKRDHARRCVQEAAAAKRQSRQGSSDDSCNDVEMVDITGSMDDDEEYWGSFFTQSAPIAGNEEDEPEDVIDQVKQRHASKIEIVSGSPHCPHVHTAHTDMYRKRSSA
jgi:hypothetical protein